MTSGRGTGVAAFATSADDFDHGAIPKRFAIDACVFMHALEFPEKHSDDPRASHAKFFLEAAARQGCVAVVSTIVLAEFLIGRDDECWPTSAASEYVALDEQDALAIAPVYRANRRRIPAGSTRYILKWDHLVCAAAKAAGTRYVVTADGNQPSLPHTRT